MAEAPAALCGLVVVVVTAGQTQEEAPDEHRGPDQEKDIQSLRRDGIDVEVDGFEEERDEEEGRERCLFD